MQRATAGRDRGFTLPELLIVVVVVGMITSVLSAAIIATLRQATSTEGRVTLARAEQSIDTWLPADLKSVDTTNPAVQAVDTDPAATPCGAACPPGLDLSGANALQLSWQSKRKVGGSAVTFTTTVQYQYISVDGVWEVQRVHCTDEAGAMQCDVVTVLHNVDAPPPVPPFDPDAMAPTWMFQVNQPDTASGQYADIGRQLSVTVRGGGEGSGAGGGEKTINLTAGGSPTGTIAPDDFSVPAFVRANSRCGGLTTLLVDNSSSIQGGDKAAVRAGLDAFVEAFRGTPVKLQVVKFSQKATVLGATGSEWTHLYDMSDDQQVDAIKALVTSSSVFSFDADTANNSGTNWEDAWYRVLYAKNGDPLPQLSRRVVFFTDGVPTRSRGYNGSSRSDTVGANFPIAPYDTAAPPPQWPAYPNSATFHQESFDRARELAMRYPNDVIAVGVGSAFAGSSAWIKNPPASGPAAATSKSNENVLSQLIVGSDDAERAIWDGTNYTNPGAAELYKLDNYNAFGSAMRSAALTDCGGTLTIQTRLADGTKVAEEFVYDNNATRRSDGSPIDAAPRKVTTSAQFPTGTFDFEHGAADPYFSVDVSLNQIETPTGYRPVSTAGNQGWSCKAGSTAKMVVLSPITESLFSKVTVDVRPNEAVTCVLTVEPS